MFERIISIFISIVIALSSFFFRIGGIFGRDEVVILYTNDVHCGVEVENSIGYAGVAAYKKDLEKEYNTVTLVDCGDFIQGGMVGAVSSGEYIIDIMNQVGYDMAVLGNHEFDYGMEQLNRLMKKSDFDYLGCDVTYSGTGENLLGDLLDYEIVDYGNVQVGFVGVSTPESITSSTPSNFKDDNGNFVYGFETELYATVQKYVNESRLHGADYVVVLSHLGDTDRYKPYSSVELIENTTGIDAVLDGHAHNAIEERNIKNSKDKNVILSSTGTKLENIGQLTISSEGEISTKLISGYDKKDPETEKCIEEINGKYQQAMSKVVGSTDFVLSISDENGIRLVRNRETGIGDLCADAYRTVTGADIAFCNGGGIRKDIAKGEITNGDIFNVHPFGNSLCTIEATGQQIADALEWASRMTQNVYCEGSAAIGENGGFLQVSGLRYTIDTSVASSTSQNDKGECTGINGARRVKDIMVFEEGKYVPIEMNKKYVVAGTEYVLLNNGDGMTAFNGCEPVSTNGMLDYEVLILYITGFMDGKIDAGYSAADGRITIV